MKDFGQLTLVKLDYALLLVAKISYALLGIYDATSYFPSDSMGGKLTFFVFIPESILLAYMLECPANSRR